MTTMEHFRDGDPEPTVSMEAFAVMTAMYYDACAQLDEMTERIERMSASLARLERSYHIVIERAADPKTLMELWREGQI